jgi:cytochrome c556
MPPGAGTDKNNEGQRMVSKVFKGWSGLALLALAASPVLAAGADVVRARHEGYRELGASFKNVNDELRSGTPQIVVLQVSARQIKNVATQQYGWFPAGSGPQAGLKTKARPEIWSKGPAFKAAQDAFARQANLFSQAAATKDVAKIRVAVKSLGATCAACHKQFRVD